MQKTTSDRLKEIMLERGFKAVDVIRLAQPYCKQYKLKLTKSDMSQYLKGTVRPSQWKLTILSNALGVSEAWLMGYDVPKDKVSSQSNKISFKELTESLYQPDPNIITANLSPSEQSLLTVYRTLNPQGQGEVNKYADYCATKPEYQKDTLSKTV